MGWGARSPGSRRTASTMPRTPDDRRPEDIGAGRVGRHPEPRDVPGGAGSAADGRDREGGPRPQAAGGRTAREVRKLTKPVLHYLA